MFDDYVYDMSGAAFNNAMLLVDYGIDGLELYDGAFTRCGFTVVRWADDLSFRIEWEEQVKSGAHLAVIARPDDYVPYDLATLMQRYDVALGPLFPELDEGMLRETQGLDLDFLAVAYARDVLTMLDADETRAYLSKRVFCKETAQEVCGGLCSRLVQLVSHACSFRDWIGVAELKARIDVTAARYGFDCETNALVDGAFRDFMLSRFGSLGGEIDDETPVLVSGAMEYMAHRSDRFAIVVMDGMSEFDWRVFRTSFDDIEYWQSGAFAMVPTITCISRQCLLANKFPRQLENPWSQHKEEKEFRACAQGLGFDKERIAYLRGYDAPLPWGCDVAAYIVLDVDERVHGQYGGRPGMLQDMELLARSGKLAELVRRLTKAGMDVYISADHGNTPCVGRGRATQTGVETETRGKRLLVVNDLADVEDIRDKYGLIEFPGTFLDKRYRYLLCHSDVSFDNPGKKVMSHGGISIDEVIVPFICVRAVHA